jgi:hypothetical protein
LIFHPASPVIARVSETEKEKEQEKEKERWKRKERKAAPVHLPTDPKQENVQKPRFLPAGTPVEREPDTFFLVVGDINKLIIKISFEKKDEYHHRFSIAIVSKPLIPKNWNLGGLVSVLVITQNWSGG